MLANASTITTNNVCYINITDNIVLMIERVI